MTGSMLTYMLSNKCAYTIITDSSGSIPEPVFNTVKTCVTGIINKIPKESYKMIINFSETSQVVSEFKKDRLILENEVEKDLKHFNSWTKLVPALTLANERISMFQNKGEIKNVIILITDVMPQDDPKPLIKEMITKQDITFIGIGVGGVDMPNFQLMLPGQPTFKN